MNRVPETCGTPSIILTYIMEVPEGEERENAAKIIFEEIMTEKTPTC